MNCYAFYLRNIYNYIIIIIIMNKLVIWIVAFVVVVSLFVIFKGENATKLSPAEFDGGEESITSEGFDKSLVVSRVDPFVSVNARAQSAQSFVFMIDVTDGISSVGPPSSALALVATESGSKNVNQFKKAVTKK
jgi:hypothetical protein